jgi:hypothetical protein
VGSGRGRVQRHLEDLRLGRRYRASRAAIPPGWPSHLRCPGCGEWQETGAYLQLGRKTSVAHLLHIVLVCLRQGCTQVFSPSDEYFASTGHEVAASHEGRP